MRRKSKEINIFSMSALDLFASGLGAFILIAVIALPYYLKTDRSLLAENHALRDELRITQAQLQQCQADLGNAQQRNRALQDQLDQMEQSYQSCQRELRQTFLAVIMQWPESDTDVDLHVVTPEGYEFYYDQHNRDGSHYPSSAAKLSRDTTRGPGVEVWEIPVAQVGTYKVHYKYYARNGGSARVRVGGNIYTNKGSHAIATTTLREGQYQQVASVIIGSNGSVSFR